MWRCSSRSARLRGGGTTCRPRTTPNPHSLSSGLSHYLRTGRTGEKASDVCLPRSCSLLIFAEHRGFTVTAGARRICGEIEALADCRSPSFHMAVDELMDGQQPKPYDELHRILTAQAANKWIAYVIGCLCVLMHELGVRLAKCLVILISSDVPEGASTSTCVLLPLFCANCDGIAASRQGLGVLSCPGSGCHASPECCPEAAPGWPASGTVLS